MEDKERTVGGNEMTWLKNTVYALGISAVGLMGCNLTNYEANQKACKTNFQTIEEISKDEKLDGLKQKLYSKDWCPPDEEKNGSKPLQNIWKLWGLVDRHISGLCQERYEIAFEAVKKSKMDCWDKCLFLQEDYCNSMRWKTDLYHSKALQRLIDELKSKEVK